MNKAIKTGFAGKTGAALATLNVLMMNMMFPLAAGGNVWATVTTTVKNLLETLTTSLKTIVIPIGILLMVIYFIGMMISQDEKKVKGFRSWAIGVS